MPAIMRINPRDFIMSPFLRCPKCGAEEYGVLDVGGTRCQRRCRACWYTATVHLPELKKRIVYIDQFAYSNILKMLCPDVQGHEGAASDPFWKELFETLSVVRHLQLVAFPDSREHHDETLASPFGELLKSTYEYFSCGESFERAEGIKIRQIGHAANCWLNNEPLIFDLNPERISSGRLHDWDGRMYITVNGVLPGTVQGLRASRNRTHAALQDVFAQWQIDKKSFKEVYAAEKSSHRQALIRGYFNQLNRRAQMAQRIASGQMPTFDSETLNEMMPSWEENQMFSLQQHFVIHAQDKKKGLERLGAFLRSDAIDNTPFNLLGAAMFASLSRKAAGGQKRIPSQGMANDVEVISALLPYCDAMFVDNECKELLRAIPKEYKLPFGCQVFSYNTRREFIRYLTDIRDSVSPKHLKLLEQVYGPDPLKPPTSIHGVNRARKGVA
ncbi:MAG TPA: hypothetical protein VG322_13615 [Candidatus Acidoferrales bacterium]|nr:hypothetical protein [Candidatus Acidoferrales bacterium]